MEEANGEPLNIIILGGDGTVNELFQGLCTMGLPQNVNIGFIPTGSSNDLVRDMNLPKNPVDVLNVILECKKPSFMDLGKVTYDDDQTVRYFSVSMGIGFDAAVCEEAMQSKFKKTLNKFGLGKLTYLGIALKQLVTATGAGCTLTIDDNDPINIHRVLFVTVMNHRFEGGGFMFCPRAKDNDGILDICAVGDLSFFNILLALPAAYKGEHLKFKGSTPYKAKKVRLETTSPLWLHTDGEVERKTTSCTVECLHNAVKIFR
ncbi:MAG: diacylglycerol kinase family lipid kinase [Lachnospiraceae bacterium]|nr:diacylglycerol kinase family lipid kinase [Lachnospiraceae bacterium]